MAARKPAARPADRPWSRRTLTHSDAGSISRSTAWPATTAGDHAVGGRQQPHVVALLLQPGALGRQPLQILSRRRQVRFGGADAGLGRGLFLQLGLDGDGAHEVLRTQLHIAARVEGGQFLPGLGVLVLRLRCRDGAAGARDGCVQGRHPLVEVHRVHLGQQLAGLHGVADIDRDPADPAGGGRPDQVGAARLDRSDAEQRRCERSFAHLRHRHPGRRQRARTHDHIGQCRNEERGQQPQAEAARPVRWEFHGASQMPRR
jgi:hypothetical protein